MALLYFHNYSCITDSYVIIVSLKWPWLSNPSPFRGFQSTATGRVFHSIGDKETEKQDINLSVVLLTETVSTDSKYSNCVIAIAWSC